MQKHLYFLCPTDHLETIISSAYEGENYYLTSLGNSTDFQGEMLEEVLELLEEKDIRNITFVLSQDNQFITEALEGNNYNTEKVAIGSYSQLEWQPYDHQDLVISYHLNDQISQIKLKLMQHSRCGVKVNGLIYKRQENAFCDIYSNLICQSIVGVN